jgi:hypothetical protein
MDHNNFILYLGDGLVKTAASKFGRADHLFTEREQSSRQALRSYNDHL